MATLAIGDIHGEYRALRRLLAACGPIRAQDRLVLIGDLVGRGRAGCEVLRWAADQGDRVALVLGNHDLHLLWLYYLAQPSNDIAKQQILEAADAGELCDWLRRWPLAIALEHCNCLVVHAGVSPGWDVRDALGASRQFSAALAGPDGKAALAAMHGNTHCRWDVPLAAGERLQAAANIMTRMRACCPDGSADLRFGGLPGEEFRPGSVAWFDYPQRRLRNTRIVCGHWSALGLLLRADIAMLDTGCCFGGTLTGLWLEDRRLVVAGH